MKTLNITDKNIEKLLNTFKEDLITSEYIGIPLESFKDLKNKEDIENYLVEHLVGYGIIKLEEDQKLEYKGFDLTEYYLDAYFRYFEDVD